MRDQSPWTIDNMRTPASSIPERSTICIGMDILDDAYEHIHMEWIGIDKFIINLSYWLSDQVKLNGIPVLVEVLRNGLNAYASILMRTERRYFPHERLKTFFIGCFSSSGTLCGYKIVDRETGEEWCLESEEPFTQWRHGRSSLVATHADLNRAQFAKLLYTKTVPKNLQLAMRRFGHETAIMAGNLDYRH